MMNSYEKIYTIISAIPAGYVATYGQVARLAGNPRWARVVGYALARQSRPAGNPVLSGGGPYRTHCGGLRLWGS